MDETDLRLLLLLIQDSRTPYSVLARRLGMSIPAVHKRVTSLLDAGVIVKCVANLSLPFLRAVLLHVSGVSEAFPLRNAIESLRKDERTWFVVTGSGNSLYVSAILPTIQDLEPYVAFLQKAASMPDPMIGLIASESFGRGPPSRASVPDTELDRLDYRIVLALHDDARKSVADVCGEVHASPKTVRNRLRRMADRGVIEFNIYSQPGLHAGVSAIVPIAVTPGVDLPALRGRLVSELDPWVVWTATFSNLPNRLIVMTGSLTPAAHEILVNRIASYEGVAGLSVHVNSHYDWFETWRDKLLRKRAA